MRNTKLSQRSFQTLRTLVLTLSAFGAACGMGNGHATGGDSKLDTGGFGGVAPTLAGSSGATARAGAAGADQGAGGAATVPERAWPGLIEFPLAVNPSEIVTPLAVTDSKIVLHSYQTGRRSRLLVLDVADYTYTWTEREPPGTSHMWTFESSIWTTRGTRSGNSDLAEVTLFTQDGEPVWTWAHPTDGQDRLLWFAAGLGERAAAVVEPDEVEVDFPQELMVWTPGAAGASLERAPILGEMLALTPQATALSWTEGALLASGPSGALETCPIEWTPGSDQVDYTLRLGEATLLSTSEGIYSYRGDCASLQLIVPGTGNLMGAGSGAFGFLSGTAGSPRAVELRAPDGMLIAAVPFATASAFSARHGIYDATRRSWMVGTVTGGASVGPRIVTMAPDGAVLAYKDLSAEPPFVEITSAQPIAVARDGDDGALLVTIASSEGATAKLQITRWHGDLTYDKGQPPVPNNTGGTSGSGGGSGGACAASYDETRLTENVQMDSYCQAAYTYACSGTPQGVNVSCTSLAAFDAEAQCKYCD